MPDVSIRVLLQGAKSVRFAVRDGAAQATIEAITQGSEEWVEVETIRHGTLHLKRSLVAGLVVRPISPTGKKASEGVTLKQIALVLGTNYYALVRRVNKPVADAIRLKLGGDRRVLLTPENHEALAKAGLSDGGWKKLCVLEETFKLSRSKTGEEE